MPFGKKAINRVIKNNMFKQGFSGIATSLVVAVIIIIGAGAYLWYETQPPVDETANPQGPQAAPCVYVYKMPEQYFPYVAAIANDRTGKYSLMGWPVNFNDQNLVQGYTLGGGGCLAKDSELDWVILDITKSDFNMTPLRHPGCTELQKQTYPKCFGTAMKQGTPEWEACKEILDQERNEGTTICRSLPGVVDIGVVGIDNIIDKNPLQEFYNCPTSVGQTVEEYNQVINSGELDKKCDKLI